MSNPLASGVTPPQRRSAAREAAYWGVTPEELAEVIAEAKAEAEAENLIEAALLRLRQLAWRKRGTRRKPKKLGFTVDEIAAECGKPTEWARHWLQPEAPGNWPRTFWFNVRRCTREGKLTLKSDYWRFS